jgi:hypothetical protein
MPDAYLVNQHVEPLFSFSSNQLTELRKSLEARIPILKNLTPFDDANYSIDEQWFRLAPYVQKTNSNKPLTIEATILNHSREAKDFHIQLHQQNSGSQAVRNQQRQSNSIHHPQPADCKQSPQASPSTNTTSVTGPKPSSSSQPKELES